MCSFFQLLLVKDMYEGSHWETKTQNLLEKQQGVAVCLEENQTWIWYNVYKLPFNNLKHAFVPISSKLVYLCNFLYDGE